MIILFIIPLYGNQRLFRASSLGATAYTNYSDNNSIIPMRKRSNTLYIPSLNTNYSVTPYQYSTLETTLYTTPNTTNSYYYETYEEDTNYQYTNGYIPSGCESGTDYSITTGEPCG